MNTKQKTNWWIDLVLFTGFITAFFLDLTGVAVHQWIGILFGALAVYHLFLHMDWTIAVGKRFFGKTSGQARIYYALDVLLLLGFNLIAATGLVISTWLNLSLNNYAAWLNLHIRISIGTLVALMLKLVIHWRWIVSTTRKIWARPVVAPTQKTAFQAASASRYALGRREFLQVMGIAGTASFLAMFNASKSLADSHAEPENTITTVDITDQNASTNTASATDPFPTTSNSSTVSTTNTSSPTSSSSSCTVQCNKNCAYPGHCRRYVDTNNSGRCDMSECL